MIPEILPRPPRARLAHSTHGRLRVRIEAPPGQGKLHQVAEALREMPETESVRANHVARSVTVTFNHRQISAAVIVERLQRIGVIAMEFADPLEWGEALAESACPQAQDPTTLPGQLNRELMRATGGTVDLFRVTVGLLLFSVFSQVRTALLRGDAIPWLRVLTYLLAALSIWSRRQQAGPAVPLVSVDNIGHRCTQIDTDESG